MTLTLQSCSEEDEPELLATACNDGIQNGNETGVDCGGGCLPGVSNFEVAGKAQKEPFLNGSSVLLSELNLEYSQTGKTFNSQIQDNTGAFTFSNASLVSPYATLRVDGFYFDEVCGSRSPSQITLNGIVEVNNGADINLNVLTHLEKARVENLLSGGISFTNAKSQAQSEILNIFNIVPSSNLNPSESLDIAGSTGGDAILIALSSILKAYRTDAEFSELMADIISDIRTDGVLDDTTIGADLLAHARLLGAQEITDNLVERYNSLGVNVTVPNFSQHIDNFVASSTFPNNATVIDYPDSGNYGLNLLSENTTFPASGGDYSLSAVLPNDCAVLRVRFINEGGTCFPFCWAWVVGSNTNWQINAFDQSTETQEFRNTGLETDLEIRLSEGTYRMEIYEGSSTTPTITKMLTVTQ